MTAARLARMEEIFEQVADCLPPEQHKLLSDLCGEDDDLKAEIMTLLEADATGNHRILQHDLASLAAQVLEADDLLVLPYRFGRYLLRSYLGQGGMGRVYLAEREDLGDRVAVKFLQDAWTSPGRRQRFTQEQRLLAALNHPRIARLYDAGVEQGMPWFAMEYVDGIPINQYCRARNLPLEDRLTLLRSACEAVAYAHRNLTVHLDLKPSNILVTPSGDVKLLDFGIARNLDREGGEAEKTKTSLRLFSLNYAAPEQIRGEVLDVQTDIHGLGLIAYELLTGSTPADLTNASAAELLRYTEEDVERPSVAVRKSETLAVRASKAAWTDLDVLCLTALHRDRRRRYPTAEALIRDLDHFEKNEPLEARTDNLRYRVTKFAARNRGRIFAVAAVLLALIALSLFFTVRLVRARDQALASDSRTQRIDRFMLNLFAGDDSVAGPAADLRVVDLLDRGVAQSKSLQAEPVVQAQLHYTLGALYHKLGHLDRAEPLLRSASREQATLLGLQNSETMKSQLALADVLSDNSASQEAERLVREVLERAKQGANDRDIAAAQLELGAVLSGRGDYHQAIPVLQEAANALGKRAEDAELLSEALGYLVVSHYYLGQVNAADEVNQRALSLDTHLFGPTHPYIGVDLQNLGDIQLDRAQYPAAEQTFRRVVAIYRAWYGPLHPKTANGLLMLGRSLSYEKQFNQAAALYDQALQAAKSSRGIESVPYALALNMIGDLDRDRNQLDRAENNFMQAKEVFKKMLGEHHELYGLELSNLGSVYLAEKQWQQAERILRRAVDTLLKAVPDQLYTGIAQVRLGAALAGQKRYAEAESEALAGNNTLRKQLVPATVEVQTARKELYSIYLAENQPAKANQFR